MFRPFVSKIIDFMCPALSKGTKKGTVSENNRFLKGALEGCLIK